MPPEPTPWERKDSAARKHDRGPPSDAQTGSSSGGPFAGPRWRDSHRGPRDFYSPPPRRPPSGHHKQVYTEEVPPRSEDEGFRCYSGRYGSSSGRDGGSREGGRGYLRRSPWSGGERSSPSPSPSSLARDHPRVRVSDVVDDSPGIIGHRPEREKDRDRDRDRDHSLGSISWKPLKWPRSGSFSSPGGSKAAAEAEEERTDTVGKESAPVMSPQSGSQPPVAVEEGHPRKRHRLGWGQGLAKYEKEKVETPLKTTTTSAVSTETTSSSNPETAMAEDGAIGSSRSPIAVVDKLHVTVEAIERKQCVPVSSGFMPEKYLLDSTVDVESLDFNTLNHVSSSITDLLQAEETSIGDLNIARQTALDRLLLLKDEISKLVEKAEAMIDSWEMELKNLNEGSEESSSTHSTTKITDVPNTISHCTASLLSKRNDTASSNVALAWAQRENHLQSNLLAHAHIGSDVVKSHSNESHSTVEEPSGSGLGSIEARVKCALDKTNEAASRVLAPSLGQKLESDSSLNVGNAHSNVPLSVEVDSFVTRKIFDSNKETARKASEVFSECAVELYPSDAFSPNVHNAHAEEKLMAWKRSLQFKEQVLTLKFKAFHHFWREDLRLLNLLSTKKNAAKLQKRSEIRCCSTQNGPQKLRSLARSRLPVPACHVALSPPAEILDMTNKLISKSEIQMHRKNLKMPAMMLDERERKHSMFVTSNGLVEDSLMMEKEKTLINPWTEEENEIFKEKLIMFGKDFRRIASFLDSKTTADCVEFYYKNHKSEGFDAVRKVMASRKQSRSLPSANYMIASGRRWNDETNTASLDVLGAASVFVSHSNDVAGHRQSYGRTSVGGSNPMKIPRGSHAKNVVDSHDETTAADVLAGIGSAMSSEGISSCVTSSVDHVEVLESMPVDRPLFLEATPSIWEEDTFSDEVRGEFDTIDWSDDEKSVFIRALRLYGKDFARISRCLGTRSKEQCRIFYSKARKCLGLEMVYREPAVHEEIPLSDVNGGRSDTEEGCAVEIDCMLCSTQSCSRVDVNSSTMKSDLQEATHIEGSCKNVKSTQMRITEEKSVPAFDTNDENKGFSSSPVDIQSSEADPGSKNVTPEALEDSPLRNHSLESRIDQQVSDDEMNGQDTEMPDEMHYYDCSSNNVSKAESQLLPAPPASVKKLLRESCTNVTPEPSFDVGMNAGRCHQGKFDDFLADTVLGHGVMLQKGSNLPPLPRKKSQVMPWKRRENSPSAKRPPADYKSLVFSGNDSAPPSPSNFIVSSDNNTAPCVSGGINTSCAVSSQSSIGFDQSGHTLGGYPSHFLNARSDELGDLLQSPVSAGSVSRKNGSSHSRQLLLPDLHVDKGSKTGVVDLEPASTYARDTDGSGEGILRSCSGDTSLEAEKPSARSGNVKLFGQILTHQSSLQKPDDCEVKPPSTKENRILNFQLPNGRPDGTSDPSNAESSSFLGLAEELHRRSFAWWDGQKTQVDLSSLANSTLCLPKCPSVVSGVAYHPKKIKPVSSRSMVMPQSLFPAEGKGQIVFPDLQNRVRIDTIPAFQQPGRVSMNLVSSGDAIGCAVVSDPVASLRLHFAKQITTSLGSSEEPHRGDLGNRLARFILEALSSRFFEAPSFGNNAVRLRSTKLEILLEVLSCIG